MTECYQTFIEFPSVKRRNVEADFSGGDITSNGGIPLLSQVDRQMGLTQAVAAIIGDNHRQASCEHSLLELSYRAECLQGINDAARIDQ